MNADPAEIIAEYDKLVRRAVEICKSEPFNCYFDDDDRPILSIAGDTATLTWATLERDYRDGDYIEKGAQDFHAKLLAIPIAALRNIIAAETEAAEIKRKEQCEAEYAKWREQERQRELALLAELKAKYEDR